MGSIPAEQSAEEPKAQMENVDVVWSRLCPGHRTDQMWPLSSIALSDMRAEQNWHAQWD